MRVEVALTELARLKLSGGELTISGVDWPRLKSISDASEAQSRSTVHEFEAIEAALREFLSEETLPRTRALAIYAMVQAWTNQMFA